MAVDFKKKKENLDWAENQANNIWEKAGEFNTFITRFDRKATCCSTDVEVGSKQPKKITVSCTGANRRLANQPQIVVPPEILRAWEKMGVDYKTRDGMFHSRPDGGQAKNPNARWCLSPVGDPRISDWAQNIANAVKYLRPSLSKAEADILHRRSQRYAQADAKGNLTRKRRIVEFVERGPAGDKMKKHRNHHCQICKAMGMNPVGFMSKRHVPYTEAHHVEEVGKGGGLEPENIIVLCANHHRQMHYGDVALEHTAADKFVFRIDGEQVVVERYLP